MIIDITMAEYLADPAPDPSLNSSTAKILYYESPQHAFLSHPRLNPNHVPKNAGNFDMGSATHAIFLEESEASIVCVMADSWRTNKAKEEREAAWANSQIPLLEKDFEVAKKMAFTANDFLTSSEVGSFFHNWKTELTILQQHGKVWTRSRLDALGAAHVLDYKTTAGSANPEKFSNQIINFGYDIQAALILKNLKAETGEDFVFIWLVQETAYPYACSILGCSPTMLELGTKKIDWCIDKWKECLETGEWPGYSKRIAWAEAPAWALMQAESKEFNEEVRDDYIF